MHKQKSHGKGPRHMHGMAAHDGMGVHPEHPMYHLRHEGDRHERRLHHEKAMHDMHMARMHQAYK